MKVGLCQIDTRIGDLAGNLDRVAGAAQHADHADFLVFPELVVTGYPPRDLLCDDGFVRDVEAAVMELAAMLDGLPPVVIGAPVRAPSRAPDHPGLYDAALVLRGGRVAAMRPKRLLPAYDVFHEPRWFVPGPPSAPVDLAGPIGLVVCEDLWDEGYPEHPPADLVAAGAGVLVCLSCSPFRPGVLARRMHHARRAGVPVVYVNAVGGNDELVFDGRSFVTDGVGEVVARLAAFDEDVTVVDLDRAGPVEVSDEPERMLFDALVLGVRSFCWKNGIRDAWLGLSGGVDSALVACIAAEALGPGRVHALAMPSRYTDPRSTSCARELAEALGISFEVVPVDGLHAAAEGLLAGLLAGAPDGDTTAENIQARLRMLVLTAHMNRRGGLLLNTSNHTELALGYGTLYADLAGSLAPIGDVTKTDVYRLARWLGRVPAFILDRLPSAELRPDQVDPFDYDRVAPRVRAMVQGAEGDPGLARRIWRAEHKRWQHGVVLKVSEKAFGTGRMVPITRAPG